VLDHLLNRATIFGELYVSAFCIVRYINLIHC
jgi:hypothetical protein